MADGATTVEADSTTVRALIEELERRFPGIGRHLRDGTSVAVDGEIMAHADFVSVGPTTEVHFLPAIGGGTDPHEQTRSRSAPTREHS